MRTLTIAAPAQLSLGMLPAPAERWWLLPEEAQQAVLCVLAAMIAAGVGRKVSEDDGADER
ncbi:MAG TPA: hypothetical protein VME46_03845 [Acidimicrobiales bacterium]|nr:hypothetical protein [Acidimicrobiales bacterium]